MSPRSSEALFDFFNNLLGSWRVAPQTGTFLAGSLPIIESGAFTFQIGTAEGITLPASGISVLAAASVRNFAKSPFRRSSRPVQGSGAARCRS
jgi:hypothetical protein